MYKFLLGVAVTLICVGAFLHTKKIPEYIIIEADCIREPGTKKPNYI